MVTRLYSAGWRARTVCVLGLGMVVLAATGCTEQPVAQISAGDYGKRWPLNVESGELRCDMHGESMAVILNARGEDWGVNGAAKALGFRDLAEITRDAPPAPSQGPAAAGRVAEKIRREYFSRVVACEDQHTAKMQSDACKDALTAEYGLTSSERDAIRREGQAYSWPPLSPVKMPVDELIERGLRLCRQ
jgi:hypothetical protein